MSSLRVRFFEGLIRLLDVEQVICASWCTRLSGPNRISSMCTFLCRCPSSDNTLLVGSICWRNIKLLPVWSEFSKPWDGNSWPLRYQWICGSGFPPTTTHWSTNRWSLRNDPILLERIPRPNSSVISGSDDGTTFLLNKRRKHKYNVSVSCSANTTLIEN